MSSGRHARRCLETRAARPPTPGPSCGQPPGPAPPAPAQVSRKPPSTTRSWPLMPRLPSRNSVASAISSIVTRRPMGVRGMAGWEGTSRPLRAVADDSGMDGVDPVGGDLDGERAHEPAHAAVEGGDHGGPGIGAVLGDAAEEHHGRLRGETGVQDPDHLGVAHELDGDRPDGRGDVVGAHGVEELLDGGDDEIVDLGDIGQALGDRLRAGEVDGDGEGVRRSHRTRACRFRIAARDDDLVPALCQALGDHPSDPAAAPHDHRVSHVPSRPRPAPPPVRRPD